MLGNGLRVPQADPGVLSQPPDGLDQLVSADQPRNEHRKQGGKRARERTHDKAAEEEVNEAHGEDGDRPLLLSFPVELIYHLFGTAII